MSDLIVSTLTQGLIYALLSYGVYITYSVLDFPDLTVEIGRASCRERVCLYV